MTKTFYLVSFFSGAVFAFGLAVSGMTQPSKVIGFLDLRDWDPSLIFVMAGAIAVYFTAFRLSSRMGSPIFASDFHIPRFNPLDWKLIVGSGIFGVGWGLGGFCPGPALASVLTLNYEVLVFVGAMACGMYCHKLWFN